MKLTPAQLGKHLQGSLAPVYAISGDEPLLCQETADAIRNACRQQGFGERQVFNAEANPIRQLIGKALWATGPQVR